MIRAPRISKRFQDFIFGAFVDDLTAVQTVKQALKHWKKRPGRKFVISRPCVNRYFRHYREAIVASSPLAPRFEGEVEVDIGFFAGRAAKYTSAYVRRLAGMTAGRIVAKRKQIKKERAKSQMVLGILRRGGHVHLLPLKSKSRDYLEAAVRSVVVKGTIVYTDGEKGLAKLKFQGYKHKPINHSIGYVDGQGNHINGIESFWREARRGMGKNFRGIPRSTLPFHIKEREFRYNHRRDLEAALKNALSVAANRS